MPAASATPRTSKARPVKPAKPVQESKPKYPNAEVEAIATSLLKQVDAAFKKLGPMAADNVTSFDALRVALNRAGHPYYLQAKSLTPAK